MTNAALTKVDLNALEKLANHEATHALGKVVGTVEHKKAVASAKLFLAPKLARYEAFKAQQVDVVDIAAKVSTMPEFRNTESPLVLAICDAFAKEAKLTPK